MKSPRINQLILTLPLSLLTLAFSGAVALAGNWPEFRGPLQDGHQPDAAHLPVEWSETKNIAWKTPIHGAGWATPVIWGNQVWVQTASLDGTQMSALCLDAKTGEVLYDQAIIYNDNPEPLANKVNTYASPSPAIEEGRVYLHFGSYGTLCLDTQTFELLWQRRDLTASHWRGPGSSAVLYNDFVILTFDGADQQYHVALDKTTGETVWRRDRTTNFDDLDQTGRPTNSGDLRKAYSTPYFVEIGGKTQMISSGAKACWAYDPETGDEIWHVDYPTHSPSSRPIHSKELNLLFINTGLGKAQVWAVRMDPEARGDITESHVVWQLLKRAPPRSSPVLVDGLIFMATDGGVGSCVDAKTGDVLWQERVGGAFSASLVAGDGHVYYFDEDGVGAVIKPGREFQLVAENHLEEGMGASPAIADNALFIRTKTQLYRIEKEE